MSIDISTLKHKNTPLFRTGCFICITYLGSKFYVFGNLFFKIFISRINTSASSYRNLASDDNVFLKTVKAVSTSACCSIDQNASCILERCSR